MDGVSGASAVASLVILGAKLAIQAQTFVAKVKNASQDVQHTASDLKSIVTVLGQLEGALHDPARRNVFNAMNDGVDFFSVTNELMAVFQRFELLMRKYDKVQQSRTQKAKWAWSGESEALALGRTLGTHKSTLSLTLQLCNTLALSSIGGGIDATLKQNETNMELLLFQMRQLTIAEPNQNTAVRQWLEHASSYASSAIGDEDYAERLLDNSSDVDPQEVAAAQARNMAAVDSNTTLSVPSVDLSQRDNAQQLIEEAYSKAHESARVYNAVAVDQNGLIEEPSVYHSMGDHDQQLVDELIDAIRPPHNSNILRPSINKAAINDNSTSTVPPVPQNQNGNAGVVKDPTVSADRDSFDEDGGIKLMNGLVKFQPAYNLTTNIYAEREMFSPEFEAAETSLIKQAADYEFSHGLNHSARLHTLKILASTRRRIESYMDEEHRHRRKCAALEKQGKDRTQALADLGAFYTGHRRYKEALTTCNRAIQEAARVYGVPHRITRHMQDLQIMVVRLKSLPPHPPMSLDDPNFKGPYYRFNIMKGFVVDPNPN